MTQKNFCFISGIIFTIVALVHLCRIAQGWELSVDDISIPMWISWLGLVVAAGLAFYGLRFSSNDNKTLPH